MSCKDCNSFDNGGKVYINQPQEPFCEQCGDGNVCVEKLDAKCVVYHLDTTDPSNLGQWGVGNNTSVEEILEKINDLVGSSFNVPLTVVDTSTVNLTASGYANHTLQADVKISADADNIIVAKSDGLYAAAVADWKVKVDATDVPDYLENQVVGSTDGVVSVTIIKVGGQLVFQPSIDLTQLLTEINNSEELTALFCTIMNKCAGCDAPSDPIIE